MYDDHQLIYSLTAVLFKLVGSYIGYISLHLDAHLNTHV